MEQGSNTGSYKLISLISDKKKKNLRYSQLNYREQRVKERDKNNYSVNSCRPANKTLLTFLNQPQSVYMHELSRLLPIIN